MTIAYRETKALNQIERCIINSFPYPLDSFVSLAKNKKKFFGFLDSDTKSSEILSCFKSLNTVDSKVSLHDYWFNKCRQVVEAIGCFSKSNTIQFYQWDFKKWSDIKNISLNRVEVKNIHFTKCKFSDSTILKYTIIQSGLVEILDNIIFCCWDGVESINKLLREYNDRTGLENYQVIE